MALVSVGGQIVYPNSNTYIGSATIGTVVWQTLDAAGEYVSMVISARGPMTVSHVGFYVLTCTANPVVDVRIETVDGTTGHPSGTLWAANTNASSGIMTSNTFNTVALTSSASISAGQLFAVKFLYSSGTSVAMPQMTGMGMPGGIPYSVYLIGGATTKATLAFGVPWCLGSSATTFYQITSFYPMTTGTSNAFNNTNSAKRGMRFKVPFPCRCVGLRLNQGAGTGDFNIILMDDSGTELSSSSTAEDGTNRAVIQSNHIYYFDNPVTLAKNTWYRAVVEPSSATTTVMNYATLNDANHRLAWFGHTNIEYTEFATATWTDTTTRVPQVDIIVDQVDDGASAGGAHFSAAYG